MSKLSFGKGGEELAAEFLSRNGYKILEKNFRSSFGEIDIIAKEKDILCFVEVKTRSSRTFGLPEEAVGKRKIEHIKKAADYFRSLRSNLPEGERIDVVAIEKVGEGLNRIEIIKNVTG